MIFTAVRRSLRILKPKLSNWNNASMYCRQQQQVLPQQLNNASMYCRQQQQVLQQQLASASIPCSPRRKMQLKLLQMSFDA